MLIKTFTSFCAHVPFNLLLDQHVDCWHMHLACFSRSFSAPAPLTTCICAYTASCITNSPHYACYSWNYFSCMHTFCSLPIKLLINKINTQLLFYISCHLNSWFCGTETSNGPIIIKMHLAALLFNNIYHLSLATVQILLNYVSINCVALCFLQRSPKTYRRPKRGRLRYRNVSAITACIIYLFL